MKVNTKTFGTPFKALMPNQIFTVLGEGNVVYMRTRDKKCSQPLNTAGPTTIVNAVSMTNGRPVHINDDKMTLPHEAELRLGNVARSETFSEIKPGEPFCLNGEPFCLKNGSVLYMKLRTNEHAVSLETGDIVRVSGETPVCRKNDAKIVV